MDRQLCPRFPDFFGIGAQKAGTTWLHNVLARHPDAWVPPVKELHYFDRVHQLFKWRTNLANLNNDRLEAVLRAVGSTLRRGGPREVKLRQIQCLGLIGEATLTDEWYANIFAFAPPAFRCGEITPEYALLPEAGVAHMLRLRPEAKFLFMMRDPIDRSWSALRMLEREGRTANIGSEERATRPGFLSYSDYPSTIDRFREQVDPANLLLLYYDDLIESPRTVVADVCAFLGLDAEKGDFDAVETPVHAGRDAEMPVKLHDTLKDRLRPVYDRLLRLENPIVRAWFDRHYA